MSQKYISISTQDRSQAKEREFSVSEHTSLRVICGHDIKTVCLPSDRDVNWRPPVHGKSHPVQVTTYGTDSKWLHVGLHPATQSVQMYTVCVLLGG